MCLFKKKKKKPLVSSGFRQSARQAGAGGTHGSWQQRPSWACPAWSRAGRAPPEALQGAGSRCSRPVDAPAGAASDVWGALGSFLLQSPAAATGGDRGRHGARGGHSRRAWGGASLGSLSRGAFLDFCWAEPLQPDDLDALDAPSAGRAGTCFLCPPMLVARLSRTAWFPTAPARPPQHPCSAVLPRAGPTPSHTALLTGDPPEAVDNGGMAQTPVTPWGPRGQLHITKHKGQGRFLSSSKKPRPQRSTPSASQEHASQRHGARPFRAWALVPLWVSERVTQGVGGGWS